jgi:hypothetical protein
MRTFARILLVAFLPIAALASAPAQAQTKLKLTGDVGKDLGIVKPEAAGDAKLSDVGKSFTELKKEIVDFAVSDVQAALDDANLNEDLISKPCWEAHLVFLNKLPTRWEHPPEKVGIALAIQIGRDLRRAMTGDDKSSMKVACAALYGDQAKILLNLGSLLGIRIATGGLF